MPAYSRRTTSWLFVALFALLSALGEGLHLVPGCGHLVDFAQGVLPVGLRRPATLLPPDHGNQQLERFGLDFFQVLQPGMCPICNFVAQAKQSAETVGIESCRVPLALLPSLDSDDVTPNHWHAFHARAPPRLSSLALCDGAMAV
jgi:hypothetical protein